MLKAAEHTKPLAFNQLLAERLREAATLLEHQDDNPFRVGAYRRAADAVAALATDLRELLEAGGIESLQAAIPGVSQDSRRARRARAYRALDLSRAAARFGRAARRLLRHSGSWPSLGKAPA